jgi:hypothetical protein
MGFRAALFLTALLAATLPALAEEQDTEHLFGFTEGSDIGPVGEKELEMGLFGRYGTRKGHFSALTQSTELKMVVANDWRIAPGLYLDWHSIHNVPGVPHTSSVSVEGFSFEIKRRLLDREQAPFGLTLALVPTLARINGDGQRETGFDTNMLLIADRELIEGRLFGSINVNYAPSYGHLPRANGWAASSEIGTSAALSWRMTDKLFMGGELRHVRAYDGAALNEPLGHAVFTGPNFYLRLAENMWMAGGWNVQVAGNAAGEAGRRLDLTNFQRHEARLRFGFSV